MRFADTSFWVALQMARDRRHHDAALLWRAGGASIRTTSLVLGETWTLLRRRAGHDHAVRFIDLVGASERVTSSPIDATLEDEAWTWLRRHDERVYSFVDATSFAFMRRHRINEALAFDGDFTAAGFFELRPADKA